MSACKHPDFVAEAISELLRNVCIVEHNLPPYCLNPLTVAEGKKLRLVIDLRHVNEFLVKSKFKYEHLRSFLKLLRIIIVFLFPGISNKVITTLIFIQTTKSIWVFRGYVTVLLYFLSSPIWVEYRMLLFYQTYASFG